MKRIVAEGFVEIRLSKDDVEHGDCVAVDLRQQVGGQFLDELHPLLRSLFANCCFEASGGSLQVIHQLPLVHLCEVTAILGYFVDHVEGFFDDLGVVVVQSEDELIQAVVVFRVIFT